MSGGQACVDNKDGSAWTVEFLQTFGSLPLMQVDGTKENAECSNRGVCETSNGVCLCSSDFETSNGYNAEGECSCFTGFGSSDGKSGSGTKRDCGYLEPLASMSG
eukprot:gene28154-37053_t